MSAKEKTVKNQLGLKLQESIRDLVMDACDVEDIPKEDVGMDDPLIGPSSPMGLDSLDAVEIVVAIQETFGIRMNSQKLARKHLKSIRSLAEFVQQEASEDVLLKKTAS